MGPETVPPARLDAGNAAKVAATMQALATPSRLLILARLREGPCPASELAAAVMNRPGQPRSAAPVLATASAMAAVRAALASSAVSVRSGARKRSA